MWLVLSAFGPGLAGAAPARSGPEVEALRTEHSRTFRGSDGTLTARVYGAPVNFRDAAGGWQAIDSRLQAVGDRLVNRANAYKLELPRELSAGPVKFADGDRWVTFALNGAGRVGAVADGGEASFKDALPGVTVGYAAEADRVKETLKLASWSAASSYTFAVDASAGLRPRVAGDGGVASRTRAVARGWSSRRRSWSTRRGLGRRRWRSRWRRRAAGGR